MIVIINIYIIRRVVFLTCNKDGCDSCLQFGKCGDDCKKNLCKNCSDNMDHDSYKAIINVFVVHVLKHVLIIKDV